MKITIRIENVYGNKLYYPICEKACLFARIAGTKTLTICALQAIKQLGYTVENEDFAFDLNI